MFFLPVFAIVSAVVCVYLVRKRWRFTDTPTSDAGHVFPGLTEVHGVVEALGAPARAASDGAPCVWWSYEVERKESDSKGNTRWVTEEHGVTALPFAVRDGSGAVRVVIDESSNVRGADSRDVENLSLAFLRPHAQVLKRTYEQGSVGKFLGGIFGSSNESTEAIKDFGGSWRATEHRLCVGQQVFLTAHARLTPGGDSVELANKDAAGKGCTFELSLGDERAAMGAFASKGLIGVSGAAALALAAFGGDKVSPPFGVWLFPLALVVAAAVLLVIGAWNRVRRARERGHFAWSLIDVACEQRSQTVPNLRAVVGAAFAHEQSLLEAVAAARDVGRVPSPIGAQSVRAADDAAVQVVARVEAQPSLRTQPNVAQLMAQLQLLNDRVAFGRRFYNDSVLRLANRVTQFPDSFIAKLAKVQPLPLIDDLDAPTLPPPVSPRT